MTLQSGSDQLKWHLPLNKVYKFVNFQWSSSFSSRRIRECSLLNLPPWVNVPPSCRVVVFLRRHAPWACLSLFVFRKNYCLEKHSEITFHIFCSAASFWKMPDYCCWGDTGAVFFIWTYGILRHVEKWLHIERRYASPVLFLFIYGWMQITSLN